VRAVYDVGGRDLREALTAHPQARRRAGALGAGAQVVAWFGGEFADVRLSGCGLCAVPAGGCPSPGLDGRESPPPGAAVAASVWRSWHRPPRPVLTDCSGLTRRDKLLFARLETLAPRCARRHAYMTVSSVVFCHHVSVTLMTVMSESSAVAGSRIAPDTSEAQAAGAAVRTTARPAASMSRRPESTGPPEEFYNEAEASKYAVSSRMASVQTALALRCLDLLALAPDSPALLLDVGCGTGISGGVLTDAGHHWLGADISRPMLSVALDAETEGDVLQADAGLGVALRTGVLDGAVSVSALQWLCSADNSSQVPVRRLNAFFATLYAALRHSARAALQFYPESAAQLDMITAAAMRAGFSGGLLVDYPNSAKAKKYFLVLTAGPPAKGAAAPQPLGVDDGGRGARGAVQNEPRRASQPARPRRKKLDAPSRRDLVIGKKDRRRRQGRDTKEDSKFTGRKRRVQF
jgi:18S rRNA (guanine1575-N7)-methyltransferase